MGRPPVQAVLFDWGGTLTPWVGIEPEEIWRGYSEVVAAQDPVATVDRLRRAEDDLWFAARTDAASFTLRDIVERAGVPWHDAAVQAYRAFWDGRTDTAPEVAGVFRALRARGLRIGVLSNTHWPRSWHEEIFARDGVADLIDGAVFSSDIARLKPHADAFLAAVAAVGLTDPAACVHVGDRLFEDVHGAQRAGLRAVHVPHSEIPADQRVDVPVEPDGVAVSLSDVVDLVDRWNASADGPS